MTHSSWLVKERMSVSLILVLIVIIIIGLFHLYQFRIQQIRSEINLSLQEKAEFITRTINPLEIDISSFTHKVSDNPDYYRLRDQLSRYKNYLNVTNSYLLINDNALIACLPIPGYEHNIEAHERIKPFAEKVFSTGKSMTITSNHQITALAPLLDLRNGEVLLIIGLDKNINDFDKIFFRVNAFFLSFTLSFLLLFIVGFLLLFLRNQEKYLKVSILSYSGVFITGATLFISTILVAYVLSGSEKSKHNEAFRQLSHPHAANIIEVFTGFHDNDLLSLVRLFEINPEITREEFAFYTRKIYRRFRMAGVGYAPLIKGDRRQEFIEMIKQLHQKDFQIDQIKANLKIPRSEQAFYFPLLYVEPYEEIKTAVGIDLASDSIRWEAIFQAIETGLPTITNRIFRFSNNEASYNVYAPVFKSGVMPPDKATFAQKLESLSGVVYITLRLNEVLKTTAYEQSFDPTLWVELYQINSSDNLELIASNYLNKNEMISLKDEVNNAGFNHIYPVFAFGKTFMISIKPGQAFISAHRPRLALMSLSVGVLLTFLIVIVHLLITRRKLDMESQLNLHFSDLEVNQRKLKQLNEHFHSLATQSRTVLWEVDVDGVITFISNLSKQVIGYKPSDLIGKKFIWELLPADSAEKFRKYIIYTFIKKSEFSNMEGSLMTADKQLIWVEIHGLPIIDHKNHLLGYRGALVDVTEKKRALDTEILLRQREEQRLLLDNIQTQVWYLTSYDTYGAVNKAHADFLGVNASSMMFRNIYEVIPKDLADAFCRGNIQVFKSGKALNIEVWVPHASGKRLISIHKNPRTNSDGKVEYVVCSAEDITEQRRAEETLKLSKERYRTLTDNAFEGIYMMYGQKFEYVNDKFCEITGYHKNELTSEFFDFTQIISPKSLEIVQNRYQSRVRGIDLPNTYEIEIITKNGNVKQVELSTNTLTSKDKPRVLGIMRDITERNKARKLEQEVAVARKAAQFKQNFLANMSHEIRTPLTGVLGMIEVLSKTKLNSHQKDYVNTLYQSGENLKEIINLILDYSKIEAGRITLNYQSFSPKSITQNALKLFLPLCNNELILQAKVDDDVPEIIVADKQRVNQVITNLISNAIKFTPKGNINLNIRLNDIISKSINNSIELKVEVSDTGIGLKPELLDKLFIPFSQIEQEYVSQFEGTGLGLAICRELVTMMGGTIAVDSIPEQGSNFWFTFKAQIPDQKDQFNNVNENKDKENYKKLRILLVEDKLVNQKVICLMLNSIGHQVEVANNGELALEAYVPGKFDLILMDIKMPVMDGIKATCKFKELYSELPPIVGLSASSFEGDREKYMASGLDEYLTKPLEVHSFIDLMQKLKLY